MRLAVCMKWVDTRPEVDSLSGETVEDLRWFAASRADQAALEAALVINDRDIEGRKIKGRAVRGDSDRTAGEVIAAVAGEVAVVCAGPPGSESMLRDALAAGATRAVRVEIDPGIDSAAVAAAVAPVLADADLVICGNWSFDRGTGSFPAFLAHELGTAQALGCIGVGLVDGIIEAERRLDGGRRERIRLMGPGVVSVEGGTNVRRAGLGAILAAADAPIEVVVVSPGPPVSHRVVSSGPFRPRSREIPAPDDPDPRMRLMAITGTLVEHRTSQAVHLDPAEAADHLLEKLAGWGVGFDAGPESAPESGSDR